MSLERLAAIIEVARQNTRLAAQIQQDRLAHEALNARQATTCPGLQSANTKRGRNHPHQSPPAVKRKGCDKHGDALPDQEPKLEIDVGTSDSDLNMISFQPKQITRFTKIPKRAPRPLVPSIPTPPRDRSDEDTLKTKPSIWAPAKKDNKRPLSVYTHQAVVSTSKFEALNGLEVSDFKGSATPSWYDQVKKPTNPMDHKRSTQQKFNWIVQCIQDCEDAVESGRLIEITPIIKDLRNSLHELEFDSCLSTRLNCLYIQKSRILERDHGFRKMISREDIFPPDLISDARVLFSRWWRGDFDPDLMRGIEIKRSLTVGGRKTSSTKIDPTWNIGKRNAKIVGNNGLQVGQWWPFRICALRDGAHGEIEAGISGEKGMGVFSVVVGDGGYKDEDTGSELQYCGTASSSSKPSRHTQLMLDTISMEPKQPIRVLRSKAKTKGKSGHAPTEGIRYDGLYEIISHEMVDEATAMYVFRLRRRAGQDPIRSQGELSRPTPVEQKKLAELKATVSDFYLG